MTDLELMYLLESEGYETTLENLVILKEGIISGEIEILDEGKKLTFFKRVANIAAAGAIALSPITKKADNPAKNMHTTQHYSITRSLEADESESKQAAKFLNGQKKKKTKEQLEDIHNNLNQQGKSTHQYEIRYNN